jgi:hypothetical protein
LKSNFGGLQPKFGQLPSFPTSVLQAVSSFSVSRVARFAEGQFEKCARVDLKAFPKNLILLSIKVKCISKFYEQERGALEDKNPPPYMRYKIKLDFKDRCYDF